MPYCARKHQLNQSLIYHVYNRSNAKTFIFTLESDFFNFKHLLREYADKFSLNIYHWVIMSNHYHLLLEASYPEVLSSVMAGLHRSYTCYYHKLHGTSGFLWQGRFKLQPVHKEAYLTACGRYIERNPVKAGIALESSDYPYSSAAFYCLGREDGLTTESPLFSEFGRSIPERQIAYKEFLESFNSEEEESFAKLESPVGNKEFVKRLVKINGRYIPRRRGRIPQIFVS